MTAVMRGGTCQCHAAIRLSLAGRLETAPAQQLTVHCYAYYVTSRKWAQHSTTAPQHRDQDRFCCGRCCHRGPAAVG